MIGWTGFLAQLVEFVLSKIVGHHLDWALDDRKRAARAFVSLHQTLSALRQLVRVLGDRIQRVVDGEKERIGGAWFRGYPEQLDETSRDLIDALERVSAVLGIYDPTLSGLLSKIVGGKLGLLRGISAAFSTDMDFEMRWNGVMFDTIEVTSPGREMARADFDKCYLEARDAINEVRRQYGELTSPKDTIADLVKEVSERRLVSADDREAIRQLHGALQRHEVLLTEALDSLSQFIRENFAIEDLL